MATLHSQTKSVFPPSDIVFLTGHSDFPEWLRQFLCYATTHHGHIGRDIQKPMGTNSSFIYPGPTRHSPPHPCDPRLNLRTNQPIPDTLQYPRRLLTEAEAKSHQDSLAFEDYDDRLAIFDSGNIELTPDAAKALKIDTDEYYKSLRDASTELLQRKQQDDDFTNFLLSTLSKLVKDTLKSNPLMSAHHQLPPDSYERTKSYLRILINQFSKGNSTTTVAEISKFFSMTQTSPDSSAIFIANTIDQLNRVRPLIESSVHPGYVSIDKLLSLVLIKGLDKKHSPNLRALEIHVQTYSDAVLDVPNKLMESVIAYQTSDLATLSDYDTEQSSAFIASSFKPISKPKPPAIGSSKPPFEREDGNKKAGREDHCSYCLRKAELYFYHELSNCKRKKRDLLKTTTKASSAITEPFFSANSAITPDLSMESRLSNAIALLAQHGMIEFGASPPQPEP